MLYVTIPPPLKPRKINPNNQNRGYEKELYSANKATRGGGGHLKLTIPPTTARVATPIRRCGVNHALSIANLPSLCNLETLKLLSHYISHWQRQSLGCRNGPTPHDC